MQTFIKYYSEWKNSEYCYINVHSCDQGIMHHHGIISMSTITTHCSVWQARWLPIHSLCRSTTICQRMELWHKFQQWILGAYTDLMVAFDPVHCEVLWDLLQLYGIVSKTIVSWLACALGLNMLQNVEKVCPASFPWIEEWSRAVSLFHHFPTPL